MSKVRFFARFSMNPFWGEVAPIRTTKDLHRVVHARYGLLSDMQDERNFSRDPSSFTEEELLEIYRSYSRHDVIELVDSVTALKALCDDEKFLQICDSFCESNNLQEQG